MPEIFVGVGSNVDARKNIRKALGLLDECFGRLVVSPAYRSRPVGFNGDDFINLVIAFECETTAEEVREKLSGVERHCGRTRATPRYGPRTMDLDMLLYGDRVLSCNGQQIPRPEILEYAFVLRPLVDIAAERRHPGNGKTFADLWRTFDGTDQVLQRLDLEFD